MKCRRDRSLAPLLALTLFLLTSEQLTAAAAGRFTQIGPAGGRVTEIVSEPGGDGSIYVAVRGVLWRSSDRGLSWRGAMQGIDAQQAHGLAVDPERSWILYTGSTSGAWKSVDRGHTWRPASSGLETDVGPIAVGRVRIDPRRPSRLYATTEVGLYRSEDGAGSWSFLGPRDASPVSEVVVDPRDSATIYIVAGGTISRSTDDGVTFAEIFAPQELGQPNIILGLDLEPGRPDTIYANGVQIYRSRDGGTSWTALEGGGVHPEAVNDLAIDPASPERLFAATAGGLYASEDGGESWEARDRGLPGVVFQGQRHDVLLRVAVDPGDGRVVYVAALDGLYRSENGGVSFARLERFSGMTVSTLAAVAGRLVAGIFDLPYGGLFATEDRGASWEQRNSGLAFPTPIALAVDPTNPQTVYAAILGSNEASSGPHKSTDGGRSWRVIGDGLDRVGARNVNSFAIDPDEPTTLFAGTPAGVFRSSDGGESWTDWNDATLEEELVQSPMAVAASLAIDRASASVLTLVPERGVLRSPIAVSRWEIWNDGLTDSSLTLLAADAHRAGALYAVSETGEVFHRAGSEASWTRRGRVEASGTATSLEFDPEVANRLFLGTSMGGVWTSEDGGVGWAEMSEGLEIPRVTQLAVEPGSPPKLYAGTLGGGVFAFEPGSETRPNTCADDPEGLCLSDGRFRIDVSWRTGKGATGVGTPVPAGSPDSGILWFFRPDNWEMLVKVLDGCRSNGHFWVFAAASTTVEYTLVVTDRLTGVERSYVHELGTPSQAVTDNLAFPCNGP